MTDLTDEQIHDLAVIVLEENGPCLSGDELVEQIALLLEDVAGFETASDQAVHHVIQLIRRQYDVASRKQEVRA